MKNRIRLLIFIFCQFSIALNAQRVGIGSTQFTPTNTLDVKGNMSIGTNYTGIATAAPSNGLLVEGNVGIGTSSPSAKFELVGAGNSTGFSSGISALVKHGSSDFVDFVLENTGAGTSYSTRMSFVGGSIASPNNRWSIGVGGITGLGVNEFYIADGLSGTRLLINSAGNVGIGTTTPGVPLEIKANSANNVLRLTSATTPGSYYTNFIQGDGAMYQRGVNSDMNFNADYRMGITSGGGGWDNNIFFGTNGPITGTTQGRFIEANATFAPSSGASAYRAYSLASTINQSGSATGNYTGLLLNITESSFLGTDGRLMDIQRNSVTQMIVKNNGNVGIGTTSVGAKLQIDKLATGDLPLRLNSPIAVDNVFWDFAIGTVVASTHGKSLTISGSSAASDFVISPSTSALGAFVVKGNGNVGVGTVVPSSKFHVNSGTASTTAIETIENTAGNYQTFISTATPNAAITGSIGDITNDVSNGILYYKTSGSATNTGWTALNGTTGSNWNLTGNAGTTAGTNFIGTTDAIDLVVKTNNNERLKILSGGNVGIGSSSPGYKLDILGNQSINNSDGTTAYNTGLIVQNTPVNGTAALRVHGAAIYSTLNTGANVSEYQTGTEIRAVSNRTSADAAIPNSYVIGAFLQNRSTGTITNGIGLNASVGMYGANTGVYQNAFGASLVVDKGSGTITNGYGLYIPTVSATNAWGVYVGTTANNYFAGNVGVGSTTPNTKIQIWSGEVAAGYQEVMRLQGNWVSNPSGPMIRFTNQHNSGTTPNAGEYNLAAIVAHDNTTSWSGALSFFTTPVGTPGGGTLTERMIINHNGNVGIGSTVPADKLDVNGNIRISAASNPKFLFSGNDNAMIDRNGNDLHIQKAGSYQVVINTNGNTGIGTNNPNQKLHIHHNTVNDAYINLQKNGVGNYGGLDLTSTSGSRHWLIGYEGGAGTSGDELGFRASDGAYKLWIEQNGNVGIGTTAPLGKLEVVTAIVGNTTETGAVSAFRYGGNNGGTLTDRYYGLGVGAVAAAGQFHIISSHNSAAGTSIGTYNGTTYSPQLNITNTSGNVGIGSLTPTYKLDVVGTGKINDVSIVDATFTSGKLIRIGGTTASFPALRANNANLDIVSANEGVYVDLSAQNISASSTLYANTGGVSSTINVAGTVGVQTSIRAVATSNASPAATFGPRLLFQAHSSTQTVRDIGAIDAVWTTATDASRTADIVFSTVYNATAIAEKMRLQANGNLGVGTTAPSSKLQVSGSFAAPISSKTSAYTITADDYTILADATTASFILTLPSASGITGRIYIIKKTTAANTVTIAASGAETIDGAASVAINAQYDRIMIQSDGTNWMRID